MSRPEAYLNVTLTYSLGVRIPTCWPSESALEAVGDDSAPPAVVPAPVRGDCLRACRSSHGQSPARHLALLAERRTEARLRREAASRRRRLAEERAEQEARLARQRAERDRAEARAREERWQAECVDREARFAAVERAHTRGEVPQRAEPPRGVAVQTGARPTWAGAGRSAPWGRWGERGSSVAPPASPVVIDDELEEDETPLHLDAGDPAADLRAGWEALDAKEAEAPPEEPIRFGYPEDRPPLTGADLGAWRTRHGLTQQDAADRLGVRQGTVSNAESRRGDALGPALRDSLAEALAAE